MKTRLRRVMVWLVLLPIGAFVSSWVLPYRGRVRDLVGPSREETRLKRCRNHLGQIAHGLAMYLCVYSRYPPDLAALSDTPAVSDPETLVCPCDPDPPKLRNGLPCSYEYAAPKAVNDFPPNEPLVWERKAFHGEGCCFLYADGHIEFKSPKILPPP